MEVHHHTQNPLQKWSHYLWEFLMLFLAVTLGFFVENQREHFIEHKREKQFIRHILTDLKEDSAFFAKRIAQIESDMPLHEKFLKVMVGIPLPSVKEVLNAGLPLLYQYDIQATTTTYNEMKTTGSLRFIRDYELTSSLEKYYDIMVPRALANANESMKFYHDYVTGFILKHFRFQDADLMNDSARINNPVYFERTTQSDQELLNIMQNYQFLNLTQLSNVLMPALKKITELIALIKKEYRLK